MIESRFNAIIGTGGIGKGLVFRPEGNHTLRRNESRLAILTDIKDYCKLHIVFHYIGRLLAPQVRVVPISLVGNDIEGRMCVDMMAAAGMDVCQIGKSDNSPTMLSMCLIYPDNAGCNVTASNSACQEVSANYIEQAFSALAPRPPFCVVALPEVPFESRRKLLELGQECGAFCAMSFPTADAQRIREEGVLGLCNLIAINSDEAAALVDMEQLSSIDDGIECVMRISEAWPNLKIWVTLGKLGSIACEADKLCVQQPLPDVCVRSSAGAGDAGLAGLICGLNCGLPFSKSTSDAHWAQTPLDSAAELGVLLSGLSIECEDTIHEGLDWEMLLSRVRGRAWPMSDRFAQMLMEGAKRNAQSI